MIDCQTFAFSNQMNLFCEAMSSTELLLRVPDHRCWWHPVVQSSVNSELAGNIISLMFGVFLLMAQFLNDNPFQNLTRTIHVWHIYLHLP